MFNNKELIKEMGFYTDRVVGGVALFDDRKCFIREFETNNDLYFYLIGYKRAMEDFKGPH